MSDPKVLYEFADPRLTIPDHQGIGYGALAPWMDETEEVRR